MRKNNVRPVTSAPLSLASKIKLVFVLVVGLIFTGAPARGAFQEALWGARPAGMAGAFTALADDANAPAYNPAGISFITASEATIMYAQLYSGLELFAGEDRSRLGLGYFSYSPDIKGKKYGSFAVSWSNFAATNLLREDTFVLTYADSYQVESLSYRPVVSYGLDLKYLRRSFSTDARTDVDPVFRGGRDSNAYTGDLGLLVLPNFSAVPGLRFGISAQNITEPDIGLLASDKVPARYTFGVAYSDNQLRWFNPSLDIARRNSRTTVSAGWESYFFDDIFALRFGGNEDSLAGGVGYEFSLFRGLSLKLDYSLLWPLNVEGTNGSHRMSITTKF